MLNLLLLCFVLPAGVTALALFLETILDDGRPDSLVSGRCSLDQHADEAIALANSAASAHFHRSNRWGR